MGKTIYSHDLRLVACAQCGAPIEAELDGGVVRCEYCGAQSQLARRDESTDRAEAQQALAQSTSESERLERLWAQDEQPLAMPASLKPLVSGGSLVPNQQKAALDEWLLTRRRVVGGAAFAESERLFHLTLLLSPALDDRHARALQESAVEILPDRRHRQVLRCMLARHAVRAGDPEAAEQWLEPCNPRATDLRMDTAYRVAASYLATARGDHAGVLGLLAHRVGDVPLARGNDEDTVLLRANALERSGEAAVAEQQLLTVMRDDKSKIASVQRALADQQRLGLCPQSAPRAHAQIWAEMEEQLRPELGPGVVIAILALVAAILDTVTILALVLIDDTEAKVAVAANTGIWGLAGTVGTYFGIRLRRRVRRLQERGVLTLAQVTETTEHEGDSEEGRSVSHSVIIELQHQGRSVRKEVRAKGSVAPAGQYPCLYDPLDPENLEIAF